MNYLVIFEPHAIPNYIYKREFWIKAIFKYLKTYLLNRSL